MEQLAEACKCARYIIQDKFSNQSVKDKQMINTLSELSGSRVVLYFLVHQEDPAQDQKLYEMCMANRLQPVKWEIK